MTSRCVLVAGNAHVGGHADKFVDRMQKSKFYNPRFRSRTRNVWYWVSPFGLQLAIKPRTSSRYDALFAEIDARISLTSNCWFALMPCAFQCNELVPVNKAWRRHTSKNRNKNAYGRYTTLIDDVWFHHTPGHGNFLLTSVRLEYSVWNAVIVLMHWLRLTSASCWEEAYLFLIWQRESVSGCIYRSVNSNVCFSCFWRPSEIFCEPANYVSIF